MHSEENAETQPQKHASPEKRVQHSKKVKYYVVPEVMQAPFKPLWYAMKPYLARNIALQKTKTEGTKHKVVVSAEANPVWSADDIENLLELRAG